ncbi:MAG: LysR family transcriptional regulator [Cyanobacteria bacterium P01_A01_bin.40]
MNFNQLRYFVEVAETNSFTKASENLFITQPSLSVSIQKLEEYFGTKLFSRGKSIVLTSSGKYLLARSKTILDEVDFVKRKLDQSHVDKKILRIGILHSLPISFIAKLISNFSELYPDIMIEQMSGGMVELERWLEKKDIDLAINISKEQKDGYILQRLFSQNYRVAISVNHHLARKKSLSFKDLDGVEYIERVQCEMKDDLQSLFATKKVLPKIVCRTVHDQLSNNLVTLGKGVAIMPIQQETFGILYLPFSDINLTRQVYLLSKSDNNLKVVNLFHEFSLNASIAKEVSHSR